MRGLVVILFAVLGTQLLAPTVSDDGDAPLKILEPAEDFEAVDPSFKLAFLATLSLAHSDSLPIDPSVIILLDGVQVGTQSLDPQDCWKGCPVETQLSVPELGGHALSLLLTSAGDIVAETSVGFDRIDKALASGGAEATDSGSHRTEEIGLPEGDIRGSEGPRIKWYSPKKNFSSFLDPGEVVIKFEVVGLKVPEMGNARVEVGGKLVASEIGGQDVTIPLPRMEPTQYPVTVHLFNLDGIQIVSSTLWFHVWPDHSWVRTHTTDIDVLSVAQAGQVSTFQITSKGIDGLPDGRTGHWYVVKLHGPAIVSGMVKDEGSGIYSVQYLVGEEGDYLMDVTLHYVDGSGLQEFGEEESKDVIGWHIQGSPFSLKVISAENDALSLNPHNETPFCASNISWGGHMSAELSGLDLSGRWVSNEYCRSRGLQCDDTRQADDSYTWIPWRCRLRTLSAGDIQQCAESLKQGGPAPRVLMAGSSQQRTLFFDIGKVLGTTEVQPKKYWTDLAASDVFPKLFFHWMVPEYDLEGLLAYETLLEDLGEWVQKNQESTADILIVQASVHDIHLGTIAEYRDHMSQLAKFLKSLNLRTVFRSGDALHIPPGGRHIIERGLRDPRIQTVNEIAKEEMLRQGIPFIDTHSSTIGRPEKSIDGYHYFDRDTEELHALGEEICIGNSVARTQAQIVFNLLCG